MKTTKKVLFGVLMALSVIYYLMFNTSLIAAVGPDGHPIGIGLAIVHKLTVGSGNQARITPVATKPTATRLPTRTQTRTPTPTVRSVKGVISTGTRTSSVDEEATGRYTSFATYSNPEVGVALRHPAFLSVNIETQQERAASGEILEVVMVNAVSRDQSLVISLLIGDAESTDDSEWYPPNEEYLRFQAYFALLMMWNGDFEWSDQAEESFWEVTHSADMSTIGGFPAVAFSLALEETPYGRLYLRGATVISPTKKTDIVVIGVDDPHAPIRVPREALDKTWDELVASLVLPK